MDEETKRRKQAKVLALEDQETAEVAANGETEDNRQMLKDLRAKIGGLLSELGDVPGA